MSYGREPQREVRPGIKKAARVATALFWIMLLLCAVSGASYWAYSKGHFDGLLGKEQPAPAPVAPIVPTEPTTAPVVPVQPPTSVEKPTPISKPVEAPKPTVAKPVAPEPTTAKPVEVAPKPPEVEEVAPPKKELPKVIVAFDSFASYDNVILIKQLKLDEKYGFDLVMVPFCLTDDNCYSEDERSEMMRTGQWTIMLSTLDKLALNPDIGKVVFMVDETDYADKIVVNPNTIATLNDLRGKRISYMEGSVGEFFVYYLLSLVQIQPSEVVLMPEADVVTAAENYVNGWVDAVSGWEPDVDTAIDAGGEVIISSHDLRVAIDIAIASNQAIANHPELVQAFTEAWFEALKFQFEDPTRAEQLIIGWGNNDWTWIYAEGDLQGWLETVAQAGLGPNVLAMKNPSLVVSRLEEAKRVWQWAGKVVPNVDYANLVEPRFVLNAAKNPALQATAAPINDTFLLTARADLPELTKEEVGGATTLTVLPLRKIEFEPDSTRLTNKARNDIETQVLPVLRSSTGVYLKIEGSSAWPGPAGRYSEADIQNFAYQRALSVAQFLAGQGIDSDRLILGTVDPQFPQSTKEAELEQDRFVEFTLILPPGR